MSDERVVKIEIFVRSNLPLTRIENLIWDLLVKELVINCISAEVTSA